MICALETVWRGDGSLGKALTCRFKDLRMIPRTHTQFQAFLAFTMPALES